MEHFDNNNSVEAKLGIETLKKFLDISYTLLFYVCCSVN